MFLKIIILILLFTYSVNLLLLFHIFLTKLFLSVVVFYGAYSCNIHRYISLNILILIFCIYIYYWNSSIQLITPINISNIYGYFVII